MASVVRFAIFITLSNTFCNALNVFLVFTLNFMCS